MTKEISITEVKKHKSKRSTWIVINNEVYDVTSFLAEHPGGEDSILDVAGKDATQPFEDVGHSEDARQLMKKYKIGKLPLDEHTKPIAPCCKTKETSCPVGKGKKSKKDKSPRTYDGSSSSSYQAGSSHKTPKLPISPKAERRIQNIVVPRERNPRPRSPCNEGSKLKWALIALAAAILIGIALKKQMG